MKWGGYQRCDPKNVSIGGKCGCVRDVSKKFKCWQPFFAGGDKSFQIFQSICGFGGEDQRFDPKKKTLKCWCFWRKEGLLASICGDGGWMWKYWNVSKYWRLLRERFRPKKENFSKFQRQLRAGTKSLGSEKKSKYLRVWRKREWLWKKSISGICGHGWIPKYGYDQKLKYWRRKRGWVATKVPSWKNLSIGGNSGLGWTPKYQIFLSVCGKGGLLLQGPWKLASVSRDGRGKPKYKNFLIAYAGEVGVATIVRNESNSKSFRYRQQFRAGTRGLTKKI